MSNEILFLIWAIILFLGNLIAFRLGKSYILAMIVFSTLCMNIAVLKQFSLFGLAATGGNALYGAVFLATDLLNEHWGKRAAWQGMAIGFATMLLFVIFTQFLLLWQPSEGDFAHESLVTLFSVVPRILLGSIIAFIIAQSLDVYIFAKLKILTNEKYLWFRNNFSTIPSQFLDTIIFTYVGLTSIDLFGVSWEGVIEPEIFWQVVGATFIIKLAIALLDTPFLYLSKWIGTKDA